MGRELKKLSKLMPKTQNIKEPVKASKNKKKLSKLVSHLHS